MHCGAGHASGMCAKVSQFPRQPLSKLFLAFEICTFRAKVESSLISAVWHDCVIELTTPRQKSDTGRCYHGQGGKESGPHGKVGGLAVGSARGYHRIGWECFVQSELADEPHLMVGFHNSSGSMFASQPTAHEL